MEETLGVLGFVLIIILAATQYSLYEKIRKLKKYLNNIYLESAGDSHSLYKKFENLDMDMNVLKATHAKCEPCNCKEYCEKFCNNKQPEQPEDRVDEAAEENVEEYLKQIEEEAEKKALKPKRVRKPRK